MLSPFSRVPAHLSPRGFSGHGVCAALVLTGLALLSPSAEAAPGDSVFAGLKVHTINVAFDTTWAAIEPILKQNKEAERYVPARLEINCLPPDTAGCIRMDSVGVRFKGNSTYSASRQKNPFRLSFDEYGIDQRWDGLKGIVLNNGWNDASFVREKIHHDVAYRAGLPISRTNYVWLYINGERYSFYHMLELVDKRFLSSRFGDNQGDRFKATDIIGNPRRSDFTRRAPYTPDAYHGYYEANSDDTLRAWTRMAQFIDALNQTPDDSISVVFPRIVNVDDLYRGLGLDALLGNSDNYNGPAQNFNVYFPADGGPMRWIPWDVSLTLSSSSSVTLVRTPASRPLNNRFSGNAALRDDYLRSLWFLYHAHIAGARLQERMDTLKAFVQPHLALDTRKLGNGTGNDASFTSLRNALASRNTAIENQFATNGITAENAVSRGDIVVNELSSSRGWLELYNTRDYSIDLSGHSLRHDTAIGNTTASATWTFPASSFVKPRGHLVMRLSGGTTGSAGPASFALSAAGGTLLILRASGSTVDSLTYPALAGADDSSYARAQDGSGDFIVARATPGLANTAAAVAGLIAPGEAVINEFMADNGSLAAPFGVEADWVELRNNTSTPLDLSGAYLSDNATNPAKWQFPAGTVLPASGYLVVWAYDTTVTGALNARWALSKDGEHLRFSNTDQSVIDSLTFGAQIKNRTMARLPDGTGPFAPNRLPTLCLHNGDDVVVAVNPHDGGARATRLDLRPGLATVRLADAARVRLSLHDTRGREIALLFAGRLPAGNHPVAFAADRLPAGTYFLRMHAGPHLITRQTVILR